MIYMNIIGMIISCVLLCYKTNYLVRSINKQENTNFFHTYKNITGWLISLFVTALYVLLFFAYDISGFYLQLIDLFFSLIAIALIDIRWRIIPNYVVISTLLSQLAMSCMVAMIHPTIWNLILSAVMLIVLMIISKISGEQIGMGDVKMITVVALVYGISFMVYSLIISMLIMLVTAIPLLVFKKIKLKSEMPFAPFYAIGASVYIILSLI